MSLTPYIFMCLGITIYTFGIWEYMINVNFGFGNQNFPHLSSLRMVVLRVLHCRHFLFHYCFITKTIIMHTFHMKLPNNLLSITSEYKNMYVHFIYSGFTFCSLREMKNYNYKRYLTDVENKYLSESV